MEALPGLKEIKITRIKLLKYLYCDSVAILDIKKTKQMSIITCSLMHLVQIFAC